MKAYCECCGEIMPACITGTDSAPDEESCEEIVCEVCNSTVVTLMGSNLVDLNAGRDEVKWCH